MKTFPEFFSIKQIVEMFENYYVEIIEIVPKINLDVIIFLVVAEYLDPLWKKAQN